VRLLTLYGKPGCCLCDEARQVLELVRLESPFRLEQVDVSRDPALERRYRERIPVVAVDGEEAFELGVDAESLRRRLGTVSP
jgi:glutaredoxin